ncbi:Ultraviolet-B receptor UVR8 [Symbiodinium microadriaticum]|uniref:Ultraviolet-B receptor UVR8 n=1 Tax=Symbiodinium microadriaticum TaxID=2951 RepID=A0A1Q9D9S1_SYMMI|nr:Ultraviolet-B receptor UVR8 [Symbiodinium microadriaticum]
MALRLLADSNHYVTPQDVYNLLLLRHHVGWTHWAQNVVPFLAWRLLRASPVAAGPYATRAISEAGQLVCFGEFVNPLPPDLGPVVAVAAGDLHTCAVKASGELVCFGRNLYGQCDVPADLSPVVAVAAGYDHTCAVRACGELVCFGNNRYGQCDVPPDLGEVVAVAAGAYHTCAVKASGERVCFGNNLNGECDVPPDLGAVVAVAAGAYHTCAVRASGELVCFEGNRYGQCDVPPDLGAVVAVAAGAYHTCAVKASGELICFGGNDWGQCGVPRDLGPVVAVAAGSELTCAVKASGELVCVGRNDFGQCNVPPGFKIRLAPQSIGTPTPDPTQEDSELFEHFVRESFSSKVEDQSLCDGVGGFLAWTPDHAAALSLYVESDLSSCKKDTAETRPGDVSRYSESALGGTKCVPDVAAFITKYSEPPDDDKKVLLLLLLLLLRELLDPEFFACERLVVVTPRFRSKLCQSNHFVAHSFECKSLRLLKAAGQHFEVDASLKTKLAELWAGASLRDALQGELSAQVPDMGVHSLPEYAELCSEGLPPVTALKKHLQTFCGHPRFRQRILWQGGIVREEDALVGALIGAAALGRLEELEVRATKLLLEDGGMTETHVMVQLGKAMEVPAVVVMVKCRPIVLFRPAAAAKTAVRGEATDLDKHGSWNANANAPSALAAVDQAGPDQTTPLFMAAQNGFSEAIPSALLLLLLLLLLPGLNRDCTDVGATPMFIAAGRGNLEVVRILLEHQADPDKAQIENRATPLLMAASKGHSEVVRLLLEANADQDSDLTAGGVTPLLMACVRGHRGIMDPFALKVSPILIG